MNFLNMLKAGMDPNSIGGGMLTRMGATGVGGQPRRPDRADILPPQYGTPPQEGMPDVTQAGMAAFNPHPEKKQGGLMSLIKMFSGGGM